MQNFKTLVATYSESSRERLEKLFLEYNFKTSYINTFEEVKKLKFGELGLAILPTEAGFRTNDLLVLTEKDILGQSYTPIEKATAKSIDKLLQEKSNIFEGNLVIHKEHGLGRFLGLETIETGSIVNDYLKIEYDDNSLLFVPIENFDLVTSYGDYKEGIKLDKLGSGGKWGEKKAEIKKRLKEIADELMQIAAKRKLSKAPILLPSEGAYQEFCSKFPYKETPDQLKAIKDVEMDLASGIPMDRLVCGDVGFGKTEVAIRAAFIATGLRNRLQVAVIAPTTLLCKQHFLQFKERFEYTGLRVEQLSRMTKTSQIKNIKEGLESGKVNIVIGTHALLADKIKFKNLGLLIIDEEQRFGVKQKEKLKTLKGNTHVLTLSATPIPRTLQMSVAGIRNLSIIATPPKNRLPINTFVMPFDTIIIREAIFREIYRGGRVFFIVPRIMDILEVERDLQSTFQLKISNYLDKTNKTPIKYAIAHGQMHTKDLDEIMTDFYDGKFQILISTTIIENGIDISMANTMIVYKANSFGLAQLYQLRGRVGRGKTQAYAYLTTKGFISEDAKKRLNAISSLNSLGVGFSVATNDMDIRGCGNLVGDEQSGHIRETGVELYNSLLKESIKNARENIGIEEDYDFSPQLKLGISTLIPKSYIEDINLRMNFYKRIANIESDEERDVLYSEMLDRFGRMPKETENLFKIAILKILCKKCNVYKIDYNNNFNLILEFYKGKFPKPDNLIQLIEKSKGRIKAKNNSSISVIIDGKNIFEEIKDVLNKLINILNEKQRYKKNF